MFTHLAGGCHVGYTTQYFLGQTLCTPGTQNYQKPDKLKTNFGCNLKLWHYYAAKFHRWKLILDTDSENNELLPQDDIAKEKCTYLLKY